MTDKDLKRLNRYQLLELLILQTNRADELEAQLAQARQELEDRKIKMKNIGSVAEASVQMSGLLEAAQNTADLFLEAAIRRIEELERERTAEAARIVEQAREKAAWILSYARQQAAGTQEDEA